MGGRDRPVLRGSRRCHLEVAQDRAAVLPLVPRGAGAREEARKGDARAGVRQGLLSNAQAELQDDQIDYLGDGGRRARGPKRRSVSARRRLLPELERGGR